MKWIDQQKELDHALKSVAKSKKVAVDTEADSLHSYFDKVCLIQITGDGDDFVIDPLSGLNLDAFGSLLRDDGVVKVLHGADYDIRILQRDFGFSLVGVVDTMICSQLLGYEAFGLAALLKKHFDVELDKSHQRADWSARPLSQEMLAYAALDTHYLIDLENILREELMRLGRWEWALEEFRRLEQIRYREVEGNGEPWRKMKGLSKLDRRHLAAVGRLWEWRDRLARKKDRPPFKILGNETLLEIARLLPRRREDLAAIKGFSSYHMNRHAGTLLGLVQEVLALPTASLPALAEPKQWVRDRELERRTEKLKKVRDAVAAELKIDPSVLAPKHVLTAIASIDPASPEELSAVPALRQWQRKVLGPSLVEALRPG